MSEALLRAATRHKVPVIRQTREIPDETILVPVLPEFRQGAAISRKIGRLSFLHEKAVHP